MILSLYSLNLSHDKHKNILLDVCLIKIYHVSVMNMKAIVLPTILILVK